jgi:hypothetical protein
MWQARQLTVVSSRQPLTEPDVQQALENVLRSFSTFGVEAGRRHPILVEALNQRVAAVHRATGNVLGDIRTRNEVFVIVHLDEVDRHAVQVVRMVEEWADMPKFFESREWKRRVGAKELVDLDRGNFPDRW